MQDAIAARPLGWSSMEPTVLGKMLRYHWVWIVVFTLVGLVVGTVAGQRVATEYVAKSSAVVSVDVTGGLRPNELYSAGGIANSRAQTYGQLVAGEKVLGPVVLKLGLKSTASQVESQILTTTDPASAVISIRVTSDTAQGAADLANGVAQSLANVVNTDAQAAASATATVIRVEQLATASVPSNPSSPSPSLVQALGLLIGLLLGIIVAYAAAKVDRRIRSRNLFQRTFNRPILGTAAQSGALFGRAKTASLDSVKVGEAHRAIRTNLAFVSRESGKKVWIGAGGLPRDAATGTVLAIAKSFAEIGAKVLVIDGDLDRSPLSPSGSSGLIDVLIGKKDLSVIKHTAAFGLDFLPAGRSSTPNPSRLLAGAEFEGLLAELRRNYDQIFIVSPPLLRSAAAVMAGDKADGVLLVSKLGIATEEQVSEMVEAVGNVGIPAFGVLTTRP